MNKFLKIELYPAILYDRKSISGSLVFGLENRIIIVRTTGENCDLEIQCSRAGHTITENYHPLELFIELTDKEYSDHFFSPILIEKVCDILSISTKCPWSYVSARIHEYENYHSWSYVKKISIPANTGLLKAPGNYFIETEMPEKIISAIGGSKHRDRILSSIHLARISKYKKSTHLTEALTDCVNALEALYMIENNPGYS